MLPLLHFHAFFFLLLVVVVRSSIFLFCCLLFAHLSLPIVSPVVREKRCAVLRIRPLSSQFSILLTQKTCGELFSTSVLIFFFFWFCFVFLFLFNWFICPLHTDKSFVMLSSSLSFFLLFNHYFFDWLYKRWTCEVNSSDLIEFFSLVVCVCAKACGTAPIWLRLTIIFSRQVLYYWNNQGGDQTFDDIFFQYF